MLTATSPAPRRSTAILPPVGLSRCRSGEHSEDPAQVIDLNTRVEDASLPRTRATPGL